jgi:calcyphosin
MALDSNINQNYSKFMQENKVPDSGAPVASNKLSMQAQQKIDLELFQRAVYKRGAKGIVGLKKQFKLMDTDGSDSVDLNEFLKAIEDFKLDFSEQKATNIFNSLDRDGGGTISIDEFIDGVIGPLSELRKRLIVEAFNHLDKDGSKRLEMSEVKEMFDGKRHPECISGEKTAEQCKIEFLNLFKAHNNASTGFKNQTSISLEDFM